MDTQTFTVVNFCGEAVVRGLDIDQAYARATRWPQAAVMTDARYDHMQAALAADEAASRVDHDA